jgi:2-polyprenyl-6-methoxyphenol hydroxylase-like FAD-dependent oxidoreductase
MKQSDVLIIGAGPTGLVLALWLTKLGVKVRIIDKTAEPGTISRMRSAKVVEPHDDITTRAGTAADLLELGGPGNALRAR